MRDTFELFRREAQSMRLSDAFDELLERAQFFTRSVAATFPPVDN